MLTFLSRFSRRKPLPAISRHHCFSTTASASSSKLRSKYNFVSPPSLNPQTPTKTPVQRESNTPNSRPSKAPYRPPSSLEPTESPARSGLPFDFRFSYTESNSKIRPIGLREPKYSPFGPGRLDRVWTGVCAPAIDPREGSLDKNDELEEKRRGMRERIQGEPLSNAERKALVERFQRHKMKRQINLGRDGLTHNMLSDIHNHWKRTEAVRIKCMGVPTVDMKNICLQLEDKTFGKIIHRHGGQLVLYRGRHYKLQTKPVVPLMLWKPQEPVYPRLIKTTIDGLSIEETKGMRKRGLSVPALTRLAKNGYYGNLVPMVRDAFLADELVRIDCKGLPTSDYKKIGLKLRDLVPCILVTFDKEQIVIWRGKDYKPAQGGYFLSARELFDDSDDNLTSSNDGNESTVAYQDRTDFDSSDSGNE
ncbi:CRS2-associated factor 1, mitochondrial [Henckelia pumila]|uniref:CRS2-associated factor 1, mitochondrial n=1 Tax=Henckelia pumila TaxID=405737 RepID=UPI003C6E749A